MKSADRCPQHWEGDRCKKSRGHDSELSMTPGNPHIANFTAWTGEGDSKKAVACYQPKAPKRNRTVNRVIRASCDKQTNLMLTHRVGTKTASAMLTECVKYLRGGR